MSEMKTYAYYEDCGFESERFQAGSDDHAIDHAIDTFRSAPDFDGDAGGVICIDEDGDRYGICTFAGENMIEDTAGARMAYNGGIA